MTNKRADLYLKGRRRLVEALPDDLRGINRASDAAEGGCGVLGLASRTPIAGRHVLEASWQMHNRGNGKGGGVAMAGLDPEQMRVDAETLRTHYLLQIALLDPAARAEVEAQFIDPFFDVAQAYEIDRLEDYTEVEDLEVRPPDVMRYFVRVKPDTLEAFAAENDLTELGPRDLEDEFVYQNSFRLNTAFYASLGEKRAFVLSHGRDLSVLKIVGYAEQVVQYYKLEEQAAKVWITHQRYPTKGRVWHPGGAHPFIGMNEALVHNGDFANYHTVSEYLYQRNMQPLFLTDTEVAALLFDLWDRVYDYPLEVTLEAMAPTTEHDFVMLPDDKQALYRTVQATHMHGSPDGPWFFILARSQPDEGASELLGITDTSMLRPQVFALYENNHAEEPVQIGLIASERQAINACLRSLAKTDSRFQPRADKYWVARGGSHTDGGAFRFRVSDEGLTCLNKFGDAVTVNTDRHQVDRSAINAMQIEPGFAEMWCASLLSGYDEGGALTFVRDVLPALREAGWNDIVWGTDQLRDFAKHGDSEWFFIHEALSLLRDRPFDPGSKKRASVMALIDAALHDMFKEVPDLGDGADSRIKAARRLNWYAPEALRAPQGLERILVFDTQYLPPEGEQSAARVIAEAIRLGWRHIIAYNWRGGRFAGSGMGPDTSGVRLDLYGDVGDYAASGLDGGEIYLHGDGQDQVGQILRTGKLVIYGDVGQTFLYGAKGGEIYVMGSAAGRPLINAVGHPRAVINGTCLDYLAESFMAGDPLKGGGFVVLNGVTFNEDGRLIELDSPYPGGNLFSLASGGAIYLRDPRGEVGSDQLNGGEFSGLSDADWALIEPYLEENERLFGITIEDLLTVDGERLPPNQVYRKVAVREASKVLVETQNR